MTLIFSIQWNQLNQSWGIQTNIFETNIINLAFFQIKLEIKIIKLENCFILNFI